MRPTILFAIFALSVSFVSAQNPKTPSTPPPPPQQPPPQQPPPQQPTSTSAPQQVPSRNIRTDPAISEMRRLELMFPLNTVSESDMLSQRVVYLQRVVAPLYRKPSGKELDAIAPDPQLTTKYSQFLKLPGTGIFRLVPNSGCAPNAKVVSASEECLKYTMPGAGNSFSFRTENYRIRHLADITYEDGALNVTGIFMLGLMTKLGDVPLESVTLGSPGVKFLADFKPSSTFSEVEQSHASFRKGLDDGGYKYAATLPVEEGTTYAYRGVAFRGKVVKSANGVRYNEMDYDKREDVIVAFRIVQVADDKSITLIWRQLAENLSPKIKVPSKKDDDESASGGN